MVSSWRLGPSSAVLDESGISFDTSGTPLDQDWHCSFADLVRLVDVLRQSWPEEVIAEMFAEASRLDPDVVPPVPPPPAPPAPAPARAPRRKQRRDRAAAKVTSHPSDKPGFPRGFDVDALDALCTRAAVAAKELDPDFPATLGVPLALVARDVSLQQELRTYRAEKDGRGFFVLVVCNIQDGVGGPVASPVSATFSVFGLKEGHAVAGTWTGVGVEPRVSGPADRVVVAERALRGAV